MRLMGFNNAMPTLMGIGSGNEVIVGITMTIMVVFVTTTIVRVAAAAAAAQQ